MPNLFSQPFLSRFFPWLARPEEPATLDLFSLSITTVGDVAGTIPAIQSRTGAVYGGPVMDDSSHPFTVTSPADATTPAGRYEISGVLHCHVIQASGGKLVFGYRFRDMVFREAGAVTTSGDTFYLENNWLGGFADHLPLRVASLDETFDLQQRTRFGFVNDFNDSQINFSDILDKEAGSTWLYVRTERTQFDRTGYWDIECRFPTGFAGPRIQGIPAPKASLRIQP